nr:Gfo/Idh/MocA family oxidoreductase [Acidobacteriota bacterium]
MTAVVRAALVGAGAIAPFHVQALRHAGFELSGIAASRGSQRVSSFARTHHINDVWDDPEELIRSNTWDALVIASSTDSIPELLRVALQQEKPVLVEKPIAFDGAVIRRFAPHQENVRVAYNRRFYQSSIEARQLAAAGTCMFRLELPDSVDPGGGELDGLRSVRENSVHGLDLLQYVVGPYRIVERLSVHDPRGRVALALSEGGHIGSIHLNWNCPANFSLVLDRAPRRFELRPFEMGSMYEGMEVIEPSVEFPVRRYVPKVINQVSSFPGPDGVKPGFLEQARSLMQRVQTGEWDARSATLEDAAFAADTAKLLAQE